MQGRREDLVSRGEAQDRLILWEDRGNIDAEPGFVDAANSDYRLFPGSPCIAAGTTDGALGIDVAENMRPSGNVVDIGAHEFQGAAVLCLITCSPRR